VLAPIPQQPPAHVQCLTGPQLCCAGLQCTMDPTVDGDAHLLDLMYCWSTSYQAALRAPPQPTAPQDVQRPAPSHVATVTATGATFSQCKQNRPPSHLRAPTANAAGAGLRQRLNAAAQLWRL
jgi:hypothetical protein